MFGASIISNRQEEMNKRENLGEHPSSDRRVGYIILRDFQRAVLIRHTNRLNDLNNALLSNDETLRVKTNHNN